MRSAKHKLKLVWDINQIKRVVNGIEVIFAPLTMQPFNANVIVDEQDTARILGETRTLRDTDVKPAWVLANQLEQQVFYSPGEVIMKQTVPLHLQAIVYDLEQDPIWRPEWNAQALKNILHICQQQQLTLLKMPVLAQQYGKYPLVEFAQLLHTSLQHLTDTSLQRIWVVIPDSQLAQAVGILQRW